MEIESSALKSPGAANKRRAHAPTVRVCIGPKPPPESLIRFPRLLAQSLGGKLVLAHVLEAPGGDAIPLDPVDWDIQRREAASNLANLANQIASEDTVIETEILEGRLVDQIGVCNARKPRDITTVFRTRSGIDWPATDPARSIIESDIGSVLMVPTEPPPNCPNKYAKIIVPLDGSARAESAVPNVVRLAKSNDAELVLCHIAPEPQITQLGQPNAKTVEMRNQAAQQNKKTGREYLNRIQARMKDCGLRVSTIVSDGGDVRRALVNVIHEQNADLVVMSSHGQSNHPDVPTGSVANFVIGRSPVPVLMVRRSNRSEKNHIFSKAKSAGTRHPQDLLK
jgi:nucleotide-binding universal stress UspA family protein